MNCLINYLGRKDAGPVFALKMAQGLLDNGHDVYAVLSSQIANKDEWDNEKRIKKIIYVDTYRNKNDVITKTMKFYLSGKNQIKKEFKDITFDIVIKTMFHMWSEMVSSSVNAKRIVTVCHDVNMHSGEKKLKRILYKKHVKSSTDMIILSKRFLDDANKNYGIPKNRIHHMPLIEAGDYKKKMGDYTIPYKSDKTNFMFFGRIADYKGLHILAKAYDKLYNENPNITLTVAGSGNFDKYREEYSKLKNTRVDNRYIKDEEVGAYFNGPNVVSVIPYIDATQSGIITTAMDFGNVIVASNTGGIIEQLDDGKIGILCKPADVDSLYEAMKKTIDNPQLWKDEREKMDKYKKLFSWKNAVENVVESIVKE